MVEASIRSSGLWNLYGADLVASFESPIPEWSFCLEGAEVGINTQAICLFEAGGVSGRGVLEL